MKVDNALGMTSVGVYFLSLTIAANFSSVLVRLLTDYLTELSLQFFFVPRFTD